MSRDPSHVQEMEQAGEDSRPLLTCLELQPSDFLQQPVSLGSPLKIQEFLFISRILPHKLDTFCKEKT